MSISLRDLRTLHRAYALTAGAAWEPRDSTIPFFTRMIDAGVLRRVNGRCGFEVIRDSMIKFTDAGLAIVTSNPPPLRDGYPATDEGSSAFNAAFDAFIAARGLA